MEKKRLILCKRVHKNEFTPRFTRKHAIKLYVIRCLQYQHNVKNIKLILCGAKTENIPTEEIKRNLR